MTELGDPEVIRQIIADAQKGLEELEANIQNEVTRETMFRQLHERLAHAYALIDAISREKS